MSVVIDDFSGSYRFLSNFYFSPISFRNYSFKTVEHAYQAMKFDRPDIWKMFAEEIETPALAKKISKELTGRIRFWDLLKDDFMFKLLRLKFSPYNTQNNHLWKKLMATEDAVLVEGNTWGDFYWGVCDGRGENKLGNMLMDIRASLRSSQLYWEPIA